MEILKKGMEKKRTENEEGAEMKNEKREGHRKRNGREMKKK